MYCCGWFILTITVLTLFSIVRYCFVTTCKKNIIVVLDLAHICFLRNKFKFAANFFLMLYLVIGMCCVETYTFQ
jgi:hypothetical protein